MGFYFVFWAVAMCRAGFVGSQTGWAMQMHSSKWHSNFGYSGNSGVILTEQCDSLKAYN